MANVTYKIGGTFDNKALSKAQASLKDMGAAAKKINTAVKGFVIAKVMQGVTKVLSGATQSFIDQNTALAKLKTSCDITGASFANLQSMQDKLSHGNFFDNDSLNNAMLIANQMGVTEEKMNDVMQAATDMAASGIMPLDTAVKALSGSYEGNLGTLSKVCPELKNLTKEELASGAAIDIIKEKYNGFAETMSNTFTGRDSQFKNTFSDLQASVGSIIQSLKFMGEGAFLEPLNKVTDWFVSNRDAIINFFLHLPDIGKLAIQTIANMWHKTIENFPELISALGEFAVTSARLGFQSILSIGTEAFKALMDLLDFALGNPFRKVKDVVNEFLNHIIEGINGLVDKLPEWFKNLFGINGGNAIEFRFSTNSSANNQTWDQTAANITQRFNNIGNTFKTAVADQKANIVETMGKLGDIYGDTVDEFKDEFGKIVNQELPEELAFALDPINVAAQSIADSVEDLEDTVEEVATPELVSDEQTESLEETSSFLTDILGLLGQLGQVIQAIMSSNWIGLILQFIASLSQSLSEQSESWNALLNCMSTITNVIAEIIGPIIDEIFKPFADGLKDIGRIIGAVLNPVLQLVSSILTPITTVLTEVLGLVAELFESFSPLLQFLGEFLNVILGISPILDLVVGAIRVLMKVFTWLYNKIVVPIANGIITILTFVANCFIAVYKAIYKVFDWIKLPTGIDISWSGIDIEWSSLADLIGMKNRDYMNADDYKLSEIGNQTDEEAGNGTQTNSNSGSASYTAAKDIYVNIYFDRSFVNGDSREIALMLRDEIKAAERLGY